MHPLRPSSLTRKVLYNAKGLGVPRGAGGTERANELHEKNISEKFFNGISIGCIRLTLRNKNLK